MARINVEDSWWHDLRRFDLIELIGSASETDGTMVYLWYQAQGFWKNGKQLLPISVFEKTPHHQHIISAGLAKIIGRRVYIAGTKSHAEWVRTCVAAGSKGGKSKANNAKKAPSEPLAPLEDSRLASSSYSYSPSSSSSEEEYIYAKPEKEELSREKITQAVTTWGETLRYFGISKDPKLDELPIARMIQMHGFQKSVLALRGARYESASDKYDPKKHCRISRMLKPDIFELFVNLGAQAPKLLERKILNAEL